MIEKHVLNDKYKSTQVNNIFFTVLKKFNFFHTLKTKKEKKQMNFS